MFEPTLMAKLGFKHVDCGPDGPHAWAIAESWNAKWDEARKAHAAGRPPELVERTYPPNSLGEGFAKFRGSGEWLTTKKETTRSQWMRGWRYIEPVFGDVDAGSIAFDHLDAWYNGDPRDSQVKGLVELYGVSEAYLAMKYWRAIYSVLGTISRPDGKRYVVGKDPSLGIRRKTPKKRDQIYLYDELRQLAKGAWRMGYKGLAAALCVFWDTQFSPVDVRSVTKAKLAPDAQGSFFSLSRAKTGKSAIGTLSYKAERVLLAYMASLPFELHPDMPIFHTRGAAPGPKGGRPRAPAPYTKDTLAADFREVRTAVFGKGEKRKLMDFRRSGSVEAIAGGVDPAALAGKMANSIDTNKALQDTYLPNHRAVVRLADAARDRGRVVMREASAAGPKK